MASMWNAISRSISSSWALHLKIAMMRRTNCGERSFISGPLLQSAEYTCDGFRESTPAVELGLGRGTPLTGQRVELGLSVVLCDAPLRLDEPPLFHAVQRGIERPFLDPQGIVRELMDAHRDAVSVIGPRAEAFEDQQIQRALNEIEVPDRHGSSVASLRRSKQAERLLRLTQTVQGKPARRSERAQAGQRSAAGPRPTPVQLVGGV